MEGMWIIPMILCLLMMVFMFIRFGRKGFGPGKFFEGNLAEQNKNQKALSVLDERYAKGEISESEYLDMKSNIIKD